ncbi:unnamed protein product [Urochloa decumbens]|uniref:Uncharacterized protein n=1 Tax=Urochloa decumbens TaxID=240449 RepID=A0ABC8ZLN6_9POAL
MIYERCFDWARIASCSTSISASTAADLVWAVVDDAALLPDLALAPRRHGQVAELDQRVGEVLVPERAVLGVLLDVAKRLLLSQQRPVGVEGDDLGEVVVVVGVVEEVGDLAHTADESRHEPPHDIVVLVADVVVHRRVGALGALVLEEVAVGRGDLVAGLGEAAGEGRAVALADGVRAGEDHELLHGEVLLGEVGDELLDVVGGVGELGLGLLGLGDVAVEAAGGDVEVDVAVAEDAGRVAGGVDEDVRAGDNAGAPVLDGGFDLLQEVEGGETDVHRRLLLWVRVLVGSVQEDRAVAPLYKSK